VTSQKRVLCVGREVGPLVQLLRETVPNLQIGAIDVLGNADTRQYVDWAFSVEKQVVNRSIYRPKHRSLEELLYELARVMLEELFFDLVIPSSPFHSKPDYLESFSEQTAVSMPEKFIMEQATSAFKFITNLHMCSPSLLRPLEREISVSEIAQENLPGIFITEKGNFIIDDNSVLKTTSSQKLEGFYVTTSNIHCAGFLVSGHQIQFLGGQSIVSPYHHSIFPDFLERNSFIPYSASGESSILEVKQLGEKIIRELNLTGMITLFFCISSRQLVPISCNLLPDANLSLWARKHPSMIARFLMAPSYTLNPISPPKDFVYRIPIYSRSPLRVPSFYKGICNQRNLANVLSHPEYPLCAISGSGETRYEAEEHRTKNLAEIIHFFDLNDEM
jgi:hypothetical protein